MFVDTRIGSIVLSILILLISVIPHEVAHGYAALRCGDETAKRMGRLTLNLAAHIDPMGSVILPLLLAYSGGPVFAYAKPVPYNPNNLKNPRRDEVIVAFAGPATNIALACIGALVLRVAWPALTSDSLPYEVAYTIARVLTTFISINLTLAFFNLIPLPPLDGSAIISPLLKGEARRVYYQVQRYAMPILIVALFVLPSYLGIDPIGAYLDVTVGSIFNLLLRGL